VTQAHPRHPRLYGEPRICHTSTLRAPAHPKGGHNNNDSYYRHSCRCAHVTFGAWAQTSPPQHQHTLPAELIDRCVHPELIPDSLSYAATRSRISDRSKSYLSCTKRPACAPYETALGDPDQQISISILSVSELSTTALLPNTTTQHEWLRPQLATDIQSFRRNWMTLASPRETHQLAVIIPRRSSIAFLPSVSEKKNMKCRITDEPRLRLSCFRIV